MILLALHNEYLSASKMDSISGDQQLTARQLVLYLLCMETRANICGAVFIKSPSIHS